MSKLFWAMLSFITRLPVPRRWSQGLDFEHYSRGIITFPLIGLLLGAISGLVFMVLQAWCGTPLAALFSVLVLVLMTGGLNVGRPPPTRMEIAAIDIYNVTEAVFSSVSISLFLRWLISSIINANRFSLSV